MADKLVNVFERIVSIFVGAEISAKVIFAGAILTVIYKLSAFAVKKKRGKRRCYMDCLECGRLCSDCGRVKETK